MKCLILLAILAVAYVRGNAVQCIEACFRPMNQADSKAEICRVSCSLVYVVVVIVQAVYVKFWKTSLASQ